MSGQQITVYDSKRSALLVQEISGGGEGTVYVSKPGKIAVKAFHENTLKKHPNLRDKIETMIKMGKEKWHLVLAKDLAWPQRSIYNKKQKWIGYAMKQVSGVPLTYIAHPKLYLEKFPDMDREKLANMLIKLLAAFKKLHDAGVFVGDINLRNVLCTKDYVPSLIDLDSCQIIAEETIFPCTVGRPEMTAPEHLDTNYSEIKRTEESDLFSLAILIFQCLMLRHPYDNIGGDKPVENLRNGHFPYVTGGAAPGMQGAIPTGRWHTIWSCYTGDIKELFENALKHGNTDPSKRPSLDEWDSGLQKYIRVLKSDKPFITEDGEEYRFPLEMIPDRPKPKLPKPKK